MTDDKLKPTQADRDAAGDWLEKHGGYNMELTIRAIRQGDADGHACVQAFARHRIAATDTQVSKHSELAKEIADALRTFYGAGRASTRLNRHLTDSRFSEEAARIAALRQAPDAQVSEHSELADRLEALHNAAKGRTFDLTPADGPIAQLTLFMHENAAAVIAALRQAPDVSSLVSALVDHNDALRSASTIAHRDGKETNWKSFRGVCTYTLAEHHETVNEARAALDGMKVDAKPDSG